MNSNTEIFNDIMEKYFNTESKIGVTKEENQTVINEQIPEDLTSKEMSAQGNVRTIEELGELLSKLLNAAWGSDWGRITQELSEGIYPQAIVTPLIVYSTNLREISTGTNIRPQQTEIIKEVVEGSNIGDAFIVYRQSFDCTIEFDFFASTQEGARELRNRFEETMLTFTGYLKKSGVKEIYFLDEVPTKNSRNYMSNITTCLHYFVRLERNNTVRVSTIRRIEQKIHIESTLASEKKSDVIQNNITYKGDI